MHNPDNLPKVSVVITTYNGEKYLREQLDSIYNQTLIPNEVLVVDDVSTDGTILILEDYRQKKGLKYLINDKQLGVNKNFEKAIKNSTGNYVALCDQDDIWFPNKIEVSLSKLREIENDMPACVSSKCINVDKKLNVLSQPVTIKNDTFGCKATLLLKGVSQGCSLMLNRKLIDAIQDIPSNGVMYDLYISIIAACIGEKYNIAKPLMYYRHHDNNVIARERKRKKSFSQKVLNRLNIWKNSTLFDSNRFSIFKIIITQYSDRLTKESKVILQNLLKYQNDNTINKIRYVWNEDFYNKKTRFEKILQLLLTFWIPQSLLESHK